ncbi:LysM peptidoglycan-binding domain-containing protein [Chitinophaga sp. SYP-B3965]|uniref:LysM peptidoglycan-binding domain-containing protein n=1 Tax=Chitinophaga sp. SYP-B3965 TaxID=2663120 RepID=UPI001299F4D9|nr:LysM peptidoglycan-binding domain-containing protein [Chitinophaga sp. SYP-B3965]MRG46303.1 LysM peptidoglycan-binding domain-containing protein [Chitinophaga sp. SYP-B3965]
MALQDKYATLIQQATSGGVTGLQVVEQNNVLYVTGTAPSTAVKDQIWATYEKLDPEMRSGDMVLNISVAEGAEQEYEVKAGDNLSKIAKNYPGLTWQKIYEANKDQIKNPDVIQPGWKLKIPSA